LKLVDDAAMPQREGEALIEVLCAGICNTDLEIVKGYAGFRGILGHEFVGRVVESPGSEMLGERVVGEINVGCGVCILCRAGDSRHCAARTVLGIKNRDGAFAQYLSLPVRNLLPLPDSIADEEAVFVEPLAAACRILEQIEIPPLTTVAVIGDGKLGQLIARVLAQTGCQLLVIGKHREKLNLLQTVAAQTFCLENQDDPKASILRQTSGEKFDVVIETSGSEKGLASAASIVKPRGTIVLKSTHHKETSLNMAQIVVEEIQLIGSRCGRFQPAIDLLQKRAVDVRPLITQTLPITDGLEAYAQAAQPDSLKIILQIADA
jgi:2-desacetyl-2-hydroxyethyl bacteriochlorophyllide A dehydrogenase